MWVKTSVGDQTQQIQGKIDLDIVPQPLHQLHQPREIHRRLRHQLHRRDVVIYEEFVTNIENVAMDMDYPVQIRQQMEFEDVLRVVQEVLLPLQVVAGVKMTVKSVEVNDDLAVQVWPVKVVSVVLLLAHV